MHTWATIPTVSIALIVVAGLAAPQNRTPNRADGDGYSVRVERVTRYVVRNRPVYRIAYDYRFDGRRDVYVRGVGTVPPKGKLSYLSYDEQIEFRESAVGRTIVMVPIEETVVTAGPTVDLPSESEFPTSAREGTWARDASFFEHASTVLSRWFIMGYAVRESNGLAYYITTRRRLEGLPSNVRGDIAVLITKPVDSQKNFRFRVQFIVRESRSHSPAMRPASSEEVRSAAAGFVTKLIAELE